MEKSGKQILEPTSDRKLQANRQNARKSTGPRTQEGKSTSAQNSRRHGLLARSLKFKSEEERDEFVKLRELLHTDLQPVGALEQILVDEIAVAIWKGKTLDRLEQNELRRLAAPRFQPLLDKFMASSQVGTLPVPGSSDGKESGVGTASWRCGRLTLRRNNRQNDEELSENTTQLSPTKTFESANNQSGDITEIGIELSDVSDTILRYHAAFKRDLFKAMDRLHTFQRDRFEQEGF